MSEIDALQQRLTAAMDRITAGMGKMQAGGAGNTAELESALEDEKIANAQLTERVRKLATLQEKATSDAEAARAASEAAQSRLEELELEMQRLRKANDQLRDSNAALRAANEEGVGDPHLINKAMMAELDSLRAARAVEVAETSSIISALAPLLDRIEVQGEEDEDA